MALPDYVMLTLEDYDSFTDSPFYSSLTGFETAGVNESRSCIGLRNAAGTCSIFKDVSASAYDDIYVHWGAVITNINGSTVTPFLTLSGPTEDLLRLICFNNSEHWRCEMWNGSTWTQIGSDVTSPTLVAYQRIDVRLFLDNTVGRVVINIDGAAASIDFTGDTLLSTDTTIEGVEFRQADTADNSYHYVQHAMISGADISNVRVDEAGTTSNGTFANSLEGSETQIDGDLGSLTYNERMSLNLDGHGYTFNTASIDAAYSAATVLAVKAVVTAVPLAGDTTLYMKGRLRKTSTNYDSAGVIVGEVTLAGNPALARSLTFDWTQDPATVAAWASAAAVDTFEIGLVLDTTP